MLLALFILIRLLGSIDKIVPTDTFPSLPSLSIFKKHLRLLLLKIPGHIKTIPIDTPVRKNRVYIKLFILDFLRPIESFLANLFNNIQKVNLKILINAYKVILKILTGKC